MSAPVKPGVSAAIRADGDFSSYCAGSGRFGQDVPVNPDMLFQAASVSKPVFATTLLRFVDKGIIDLDADISGVVPEYAKVPVTFADLLSHTAGFNLHGFPGYPAAHEPFTLEDILDGKGLTDGSGFIFYAAKTAELNGGIYLCGWLGRAGMTSDSGFYQWAGSVMNHQLVQHEDKTLGVKAPDTFYDYFTIDKLVRAAARKGRDSASARVETLIR